MELIESIAWVGVGFGPTLLALQLLSLSKEKGVAVGRRLSLKDSMPKTEVTL